jgi:hypothetical protein
VVFLLATMFGELTLFLASAALVDRARPDVPHLDGRLPTSGFPSGHVAATSSTWTCMLSTPKNLIELWPSSLAINDSLAFLNAPTNCGIEQSNRGWLALVYG